MPHDVNSHTGPGRLLPAEARRHTARATTLSVAVALTLVLAKLAAWIASGSIAMLASLADSGLDLAASLTTFFAVRYAASPADKEHRYGHGKAEAAASVLQALLVGVSAGYLIWEAGHRLADPQPVQQGGWAIAVMVLSILMTLGLVWVQTRAIKATGSVAVEGDRAHYMADLGANVSVIAGIALAAFAGITSADPIIAIGVALWLLWSAWGVARNALDHLLDKELPDEVRHRIKAIAEADSRIRGVHLLRTRAAGPLVHIQFHADLDPHLSLLQAHEIIVEAENRLLAEFPAADILIHADPEGMAEPHGSDFFRSEAARTEDSA